MPPDATLDRERSRKLATQLLTGKLGPLHDYPETVIEQARQTYADFIQAYTHIMQLKDPRQTDAQTDRLQIDRAVVDEMRHFFSDYQHITREYIRLDRLLSRLAQTRRDAQPQRYQQIVDEIQSPAGQADLMRGIIE